MDCKVGPASVPHPTGSVGTLTAVALAARRETSTRQGLQWQQ